MQMSETKFVHARGEKSHFEKELIKYFTKRRVLPIKITNGQVLNCPNRFVLRKVLWYHCATMTI